VTQALTRKYLSPTLPDYLHSLLPSSTDAITSALVKMGLMATATSMEYLEAESPLIAPPVTVSSSHTKHALEDLHPNIAVFRHPDHLPDAQTVESSLLSSLSNLKLNAANVSKLGSDALKSLYGVTDDVILYWAHHEKLCLVDGKIAFMGGLDLCYGRWDTNQHAIADAHPYDLNATVFPGQDYNNARIMDFDDVVHWQNNKLDRKTSSRMGWSDISISLHGPVVQDLRRHFVDRWNFILDEKYTVRKDARYSRLSLTGPVGGPASRPQSSQYGGSYQQENLYPSPAPTYGAQPQFPPPPGSSSSYTANLQTTSSPHSPLPPYQSSQSQPFSQGAYAESQHGQYYPPPPPGGPPSSQYGADQQAANSHYGRPPPPQHGYSAELEGTVPQSTTYGQQQTTPYYPPPPTQQTRGLEGDETSNQPYVGERGVGGKSSRYGEEGRRLKDEVYGIGNILKGHAGNRLQNAQGKYFGGTDASGRPLAKPTGAVPCQIVRSCTKWSNGTPAEHSIQDAYIDIIQRSQHFVYIENQFFITATGDSQKPVKNQIGKAIVERIVRAARAGQRYKVIVLMPSIPAFAGDLRDDAALGTRAIMEFQYNSINRGGHSIMEMIGKEGINPMEYIRFYNLRNYDRINVSDAMQQVEGRSGVNYEDARRQHDDAVGAGYGGQGEGSGGSIYNPGSQYQQYQQAAQQVSQGKPTGSGRWDTVSECYMLGGEDLRNVPWDSNGGLLEIDAFVSEELYIHSKVRKTEYPTDCR
jgi:phospholipase D1/2